MADTSGKTMDPKNVVYPADRHAVLGAWSSMNKSNLQKILLPLIDGELDKLKLDAADALIAEARKKKEAVKDTYFKIGLIGSDLVLRVKAKQKGIAQILGYDQKDALLLKGCSLKAAAAAKKATDDIDFPTFMALTPGDCKPLLNEYLDIGTGYGIKLSLKVEGADKSAGLRGRVADVHKRLCDDYSKKARAIADEVAATLAKLTVKSGTTLEKVAAEADKQFKALFHEATVAKVFEDAVGKMVAADNNLKQHLKEWKIKGACTAIVTTIKLAAAFVRLAASHGADVTAYKSVVSCAMSFYTLIKDFMKTEAAAAAELDKAIELYKSSASDFMTAVQKAYDANKLAAKTKLQQIAAAATTAGEAVSVAQDKVTRAIKDFIGKDVAQQPETVRRRYLVALGQLLAKLDEQFKKMSDAMDKFKDSSIKDAVAAWPKLQKLKTGCAAALKFFQDRKDYAEQAKATIASLNIKVDDTTDLEKLKGMVAGLRGLKPDMVIGGAAPAATIASTVYSAYSAVSGLVQAVSAFA